MRSLGLDGCLEAIHGMFGGLLAEARVIMGEQNDERRDRNAE